MAPCLAIIYMAVIVDRWRELAPSGVKLDSDLVSFYLQRTERRRRKTDECFVSDVEFADDITAADDCLDKAREKAIALDQVTRDFGCKIAWAKTKVLTMGAPKTNIHLVDSAGVQQEIEGVDSFVLLGSAVNSTATMDAEVDERIRRGTKAFHMLRQRVFTNKHLPLLTKVTIYRVVILATLLYSSECWYCLNNLRHLRKLEAFNMRCVRDICGVYRMQQHQQHITNLDLRKRLQLESIEELSCQRQLSWLGHIARQEDSSLTKLVTFAWLPEGVRKVKGRAPRQTFAGSVTKRLKKRHIDPLVWYRLAQDRPLWRSRAVYGIREGEKVDEEDVSDDEGNGDGRRKKAIPVRKRAYLIQTKRAPQPRWDRLQVDDHPPRDPPRYHCPHKGCDYISTKRGAAIHYAKRHGKTQRDIERHGPYTCDICQRVFPTRQGMNCHKTRMHGH